MKVTVVTLYDDSAVEHHVGVVEGEVSPEERARLRTVFDAEGEGGEDERTLYFREVELCKVGDLQELLNIDGG